MKKFTVRVELHAARDDSYSKLHKAMDDEGFRRVVSIEAISTALPTAEYRYFDKSDTKTLSKIADRVENIAAKIKTNSKKEAHILVTQGSMTVRGTAADFG